jgi:hypothetical protein
VNGLQSLRRPEDVARIRGKTIAEVLPWKPPAEPEAEEAAAAAPAEALAEEPTATAGEPAAATEETGGEDA